MRDDDNILLIHLLSLPILTMIFSGSSSSRSEILILPLQIQKTTPNKLPFRHNVSLTVSLSVGSPPQNVTMVLDTGSELSWLRTQSFDPTLSGSYHPVRCSSAVCTNRTRDFTVPPSCDARDLCHATLTYADFSSSEGNLAAETFRFGAGLEIPGLVFGCMDRTFSSSPDQTAGLIGMNRGSLSLVSQMSFPRFSYCISGYDAPGVLVLGAAALAAPLNYTPLVSLAAPLPYFDRVAYTVRLVGIEVSGDRVAIEESVFVPDHTGAGQTMVDSGTQFTFLLGAAYAALRGEFLNRTRPVLRVLQEEEENFVFEGAMDLCYRVGREAEARLPELVPAVSLVLEGAEMRVSGERVLYKVPGEVRGSDAVYCFTFGNSDLLGVEAFLIGHHHQQNVWMEFDLEKSRLGLAQTRCDLAVQRLGLSS